jgi:rod shape determining protein RodA
MAAAGRAEINDSGNSLKKSPRSFAAFVAGFDWVQIIALVFLLAIGLIFIRSIGIQIGTKAASLFFQKQLTQWIPLGMVFWLFFALIDYRKLYFRTGGVFFFLATTAALLIVLKFGVTVFGARRWLMIGSFRLQPSEFGKLSLILVLAWLFSTPRFSGARWAGIITGMVMVLVPAFLIYKEPDLGGTLILFPIAGAMLLVSGLKWRWLLLIAVVCCGAFLALRAVVLSESPPPFIKSYQMKRLKVFFKPNSDISNSGHNVYQSRLAVGAGGLHGKGIGNGTQNQLGFLPQTVSNNDFIFSVIAEETGFTGCLLLLAGYAVLFYSVLRTAFNAPPYGRMIATGICAMLFCHTYINIGMCIGLAPVTGLPLPFVSYGGSFIFVGMMSMGILQSIHRYGNSEK